MGNTNSSHNRMKKRLLQNKFHKLSDNELKDAYYMLKPDLSLSTFVNQRLDPEYNDEILLQNFFGSDQKYLNSITKDPISPERLHEIYLGVCKELNRRYKD